MRPIDRIREKLKGARGHRGAESHPPDGGYAAADMLRRRVRAGDVELPILNLAGLWALRTLVSENGDDADALLKIIWVLHNQESDRILEVATAPPSSAELAALGRTIDLATLPDYLAALAEMLSLVSKKKAAAAPKA